MKQSFVQNADAILAIGALDTGATDSAATTAVGEWLTVAKVGEAAEFVVTAIEVGGGRQRSVGGDDVVIKLTRGVVDEQPRATAVVAVVVVLQPSLKAESGSVAVVAAAKAVRQRRARRVLRLPLLRQIVFTALRVTTVAAPTAAATHRQVVQLRPKQKCSSWKCC